MLFLTWAIKSDTWLKTCTSVDDYSKHNESKTPLKMISYIMFLEQSNESIMKTVDELIKAENG